MSILTRMFPSRHQPFFDLLKKLGAYQLEIADLFQSATTQLEKLPDFAERAKKIEHAADESAHELLDMLNKTFVTPIDREDLYLLAHELDDIVDLIENVMKKMELCDVRASNASLNSFAHTITLAARDLQQMLEHFQELKRSDEILQLKVKIHEHEDQGDETYYKALKQLFQSEKDPIEVIKWKDIYENLEEVLDHYQKVSDTLEGVIVKSS